MAVPNGGELDAALLHHELIVAALQSHARLAEIEDEYQAKLSAFWDEAKIYTASAIAKEAEGFKRLQKENARLTKKVRGQAKRITAFIAADASKKKRTLTAKKRKARK